MTDEDLAFMELRAVAQTIASGEVSAREVTTAQLERIKQHNDRLGSYVTLMADSALREADAADLAIARGEPLQPLTGVPVAVKDLCDAAGVPTIAGMPRVRGQVAPAAQDATVVARLRAAGAVILGKLQLTEGAVAHHHPDITPPLNPHQPEYWSGASSSGSGVATAAGLCYASLGSDTGGSIRFPAFANGVTGLKQSWGRVSRAGVFPLSWSLDHVGPLARSAADCAVVLEVIAGSDPRDPTALPAPVPDYTEAINKGVRGLRVGLDEQFACEHVDAATVAALEQALAILVDAGAERVPAAMPPTDDIVAAWFPLCTAEAAAAHAATYPARAADYGPGLAGLLDTGHETSGIAYAEAHDLRQRFRGQMARLYSGVDIMLAPALMRQNMRLDEFASFGDADTDWPELLRFTAPFDIAGTPTLSLPAGLNPAGAPYGFQLTAAMLNESALIQAGHVIQQATDWHRARPQLPASPVSR